MGRLQRPLAAVFSAGRSDVNPHPGNETAYSTTSASGGSPCTPGRAAKPELHRKLTLVSGAAGFGKTTLLSAWIAGSDLPAAWLSLDEADSDPTRFPTYLVAAVRTIAPNIGDAVLADLLEKTSQPPPTESVLTTLLNDHRDYPGQFRADSSTTTTPSMPNRSTLPSRFCSRTCQRRCTWSLQHVRIHSYR